MGGTYMLQAHEDFVFENLKGGDRFKDASVDWKIILKWTLTNGFIWHRLSINDSLL
jgi:hypothetical protein